MEINMIVMIDNYDSFTYNVYQIMKSMYHDMVVYRNDQVTVEQLEEMKPEAIVISPGPSYPNEAGISEDVIRHFAGNVPILGVCLGHQAIGEVFGGKIVRAQQPMHGKVSEASIDNTCPIFAGLPEKMQVARYHSLVIERESVPDCLEIIGEVENGEIMAVRHREYPVYGVQFHPESILCPMGPKILYNFLSEVVGLSGVEGARVAIPERERTSLKRYIAKVGAGENLSREEAHMAMNIIFGDGANEAQIGAFVMGLMMKGVTADEKEGFNSAASGKSQDCRASVREVMALTGLALDDIL
jgi:anthranilate synthase/phosphoribosyltransferase